MLVLVWALDVLQVLHLVLSFRANASSGFGVSASCGPNEIACILMVVLVQFCIMLWRLTANRCLLANRCIMSTMPRVIAKF